MLEKVRSRKFKLNQFLLKEAFLSKSNALGPCHKKKEILLELEKKYLLQIGRN